MTEGFLRLSTRVENDHRFAASDPIDNPVDSLAQLFLTLRIGIRLKRAQADWPHRGCGPRQVGPNRLVDQLADSLPAQGCSGFQGPVGGHIRKAMCDLNSRLTVCHWRG